MAFRADEAAVANFDRAKRFLIDHEWSSEVKSESEDCLHSLVARFGPVVDSYPSWHPFVRNHEVKMPEVWPSDRTGFNGIDHTIGFVNAFLTCPYTSSGKVEKLKESISKFSQHPAAIVSIEPVDAEFYSLDATPVLIICDWSRPLEVGNQVPKSLALPLMIENELRGWTDAQLAERWETMRPYILGEPHGARSSLFVSQETAMVMKRSYTALVESGMYGPLRMD